MFLAKTWKTVNGKRYESWVLKAGIWDKEHKRYKQIHLAYVGKSRRMNLEKAHAICQKLGITLEELRRVRRLRIVENGSVSAPRLQGAVTGPVAAETPIIKQTSSRDAQIIEEVLVVPNTSVPEHEQLPTLERQIPEAATSPAMHETSILTPEKGLPIGPQSQEEAAAFVVPDTPTPEQTPALVAASASTSAESLPRESQTPQEIATPPLPENPAVERAPTTGSQPGQETTVEVKLNIPSLIKELRERFELEASMKGYQLLAIRIGAIHITALELRLAEAGRTVLSLDKQKRIEEAWRKPQKGKSE